MLLSQLTSISFQVPSRLPVQHKHGLQIWQNDVPHRWPGPSLLHHQHFLSVVSELTEEYQGPTDRNKDENVNNSILLGNNDLYNGDFD